MFQYLFMENLVKLMGGEVFKKISLQEKPILIILPNCKISTKEAFENMVASIISQRIKKFILIILRPGPEKNMMRSMNPFYG